MGQRSANDRARGRARQLRRRGRALAVALVCATSAGAIAATDDGVVAWSPADAEIAGEPRAPEMARLMPRMTGEDGPYRAIDVAPDGSLVVGGPDALVVLDADGRIAYELRVSVATFSAAVDDVVWAVRRPRGHPSRVVRWLPGEARIEAWTAPEIDGAVPDLDAVFALGPGRALVASGGRLFDLRTTGDGGTAEGRWLDDAGSVSRAIAAPQRLGAGRFVHLGGCRRFSGPVAGFVVVRGCGVTVVDGRSGTTEHRLDGVDDVVAVPGRGLAAVGAEALEVVASTGETWTVPLPGGIEGDPLLVGVEADGSVVLVGQTSRRTWRLPDSAWAERGGEWETGPDLPMAIGRPVAVASPKDGRGLLVLGVGGVARVDENAAPRIVHRVSALDAAPASVLLIPLLVVAAGLIGVVGLIVYLVSRARRAPERWSLVDAAIAVALFTFGQIFGLLLWLALGGAARTGPGAEISNEAVALSFLAGGLLASGWILRCLNRRALPLSSIGWTWSHAASDVSSGMLLVIPAYLTVFAVGVVAELLDLPAFLHVQEETTSMIEQTDPVAVLSLVLMAVVFAPLFEEIVFRGIVLRTIEARFGPVAALAGTSVLFGLAHIEGVLTTTILGIYFAWITLKTGRLGPAIVAHALTNAISLTLLFLGVAG